MSLLEQTIKLRIVWRFFDDNRIVAHHNFHNKKK